MDDMDMMMDMGTCPMVMYFHWSMSDCILFRQLQPHNAWQYTLAVIVLFIMCILREFVLYFSKWWEYKTLYPHQFGILSKFWITSNDVKKFKSMKLLKEERHETQLKEFSLNDKNKVIMKQTHSSSPVSSLLSLSVASKSGQIWYNNGYPFHLRIIDGITFGFSLLLGYWLMLIVMTYNGGYFITICIGLIMGRIIFYGQTKNLSACLALHVDENIDPSESCH